MSYTLVCVVRVIHTVRNFLFKSQSKYRQGILPVFLGVLLRVFVSLYVALQDKEIERERERERERESQKSLVVANYSQITPRNCQDLVKI